MQMKTYGLIPYQTPLISHALHNIKKVALSTLIRSGTSFSDLLRMNDITWLHAPVLCF